MDCASLRLQSGAQRATARWQHHTSKLGGSYSKETWPSQVEGKEHLVQLMTASKAILSQLPTSTRHWDTHLIQLEEPTSTMPSISTRLASDISRTDHMRDFKSSSDCDQRSYGQVVSSPSFPLRVMVGFRVIVSCNEFAVGKLSGMYSYAPSLAKPHLIQGMNLYQSENIRNSE